MIDEAKTTTVVQQLRFTAGALSRLEGPFGDQQLTPGAAAQAFPQIDIPTGGYERTVYIQVLCTTAANAAAVTFNADGPWNALTDITFRDARGNTIIGPLSGFDLFLANKWLGYQFNTDMAAQPTFVQTAGAIPAGGSFEFILPIPLEIIGRDAIGALANGASNTALRVNCNLAPAAAIYGVAPTTLAPVRMRCYHEAWQQPAQSAADGMPYAQTPFGLGTYHQLTKTNYQYNVGENRIALARKGNPLRGHLLVFRTAAGVRTATPALLGLTPVQFFYEGSDLLSADEKMTRFLMWARNMNAAANIETGLLVHDWASDFDGKVGAELREQWLRSAPGSRLELRFTAAVAGVLDVITDEVVPQGDVVYAP